MDKRKVVLEHREALDALDQAASKKKSCAIKSRCGDKVECLDCPAFKEYQNRKCIFKEKAAALKEVNKQVVQQNDVLAQQQVIERQQQRLAKRQQKQNTKVTTPMPPNRKVILIPKKEKKERKREMTVTKKDVLPKPNFTREDLTKERYLQHRDVENLTQMQIAKMYNIPHGSITGFIKKLMAKDSKENIPTTTPEAPNFAQLESNYNQIVKEQQQLQASYNDLHVSYNKLQQELATSKEMNQLRQETIIQLENELNVVKQNDIMVECDYKALYEAEIYKREAAEKQAEQYNLVANDYALALENYQKEIEALIHSRDLRDEEVTAAMFEREREADQYEIQLLKRILQLKQQ